MMNASELVFHPLGPIAAVDKLFVKAENSPVSLVRFACHFHEFEAILPVCAHLKKNGYQVGINLMQVADRSKVEIENIGKLANNYPLDVLYFADSLGSLNPDQVAAIVSMLRLHWSGDLGVHTHDNMGSAVANTFRAVDEGVSWIDSTVTGMGRGPGNAQTEYVLLEMARRNGQLFNLTPLLSLIRRRFGPMREKCGWGSNPFYYLAGQYGIHPTYVQEMLSDPRFDESEILFVLEHLRSVGGKKYNPRIMDDGRQIYGSNGAGTWEPTTLLSSREVLIIGAGESTVKHRIAIEQAIKERNLFVIALNTHQVISSDLINLRVACHPFRLLADCNEYRSLKQPLVLPHLNTPQEVIDTINGIVLYDFGLMLKKGVFEFHKSHAVVPALLAITYALAIATSGGANRILLAGFDGFASDDSRSAEMSEIFRNYQEALDSLPLNSITPTRYNLPITSVYSF
jgi:4-hydroxy 2-oxovalerate aldolase